MKIDTGSLLIFSIIILLLDGVLIYTFVIRRRQFSSSTEEHPHYLAGNTAEFNQAGRSRYRTELKGLRENNSWNADISGRDLVYYHKDAALVWIVGIPGSGLNIISDILLDNGEISCMREDNLIYRLLDDYAIMMGNIGQRERLNAAKVTQDVLDAAMGAYILSLFSAAEKLCNIDGYLGKYMSHILQIFPKSKFIFITRDGRSMIQPIIAHKQRNHSEACKRYRERLSEWNMAVYEILSQCRKVGPAACLHVRIEELVYRPTSVLPDIFKHFGINTDANHTVFKSYADLGCYDGVKEDNILTSWVRTMPEEVKAVMNTVAPVLAQLGYDANARTAPGYGQLDTINLYQHDGC